MYAQIAATRSPNTSEWWKQFWLQSYIESSRPDVLEDYLLRSAICSGLAILAGSSSAIALGELANNRQRRPGVVVIS